MQQQPLAVAVEPPDGEHPRVAVGDQLRRRRAPPLVGKGRHIAAGLVEHEIDQLRCGGEGLSVHLNAVARGVSAVAEGGHLTVDAHAPGSSSSSAARREHSPLRAINFCSRSVKTILSQYQKV